MIEYSARVPSSFKVVAISIITTGLAALLTPTLDKPA
jgi:hypothetical protein